MNQRVKPELEPHQEALALLHILLLLLLPAKVFIKIQIPRFLSRQLENYGVGVAVALHG
jgi:hypothetical protein